MTILVTECENGEWCAVSSLREGRVGTYLSDSFTGHVSFDGGLDNTNCGYTGYWIHRQLILVIMDQVDTDT